MVVRSRSIEVGDEPVRLDTAAAGPSVIGQGFSGRVESGTLFIGGADVTVDNGVPVNAGEWLPGMDLTDDEELWAVCEYTEDAVVRVIERGVSEPSG